MKKININLANQKEKGGPLNRVLAASLALLAVIYTLYNVDSYRKTSSQLEKAQRRLTELTAASARAGSSPDAKQLKKEIEFLNDIIVKKIFSWTELLSNLEECVPEDAYVVQISPDFAGGKVSVTGMARDVRHALSMVDSMTESGQFSDVFLTRHSGVKDSGMTLFSITARYKGVLEQ